MKTAAIIAEYNPFHKGHEYHISQVRKETGTDYIIIVMSGDYTQRGEPAIFSKHFRAKMALMGGADLCLELPNVYACGSADYFARGAISILNALGVVDILSFGSESGTLFTLDRCAKLLSEEPYEYSTLLKNELSLGKSFPLARNNALKKLIRGDFSLSTPNDILAVEYLKHLHKTNSSITPHTILRLGDYHSGRLLDNDSPAEAEQKFFSSASAIRNHLIDNNSFSGIFNGALFNPDFNLPDYNIPPYCMDIIKSLYSQNRYPISLNDFSGLLCYKLLSLHNTGTPLSDYYDVSKALSDRICNQISNPCLFESFEAFCNLLKNKSTTYTHISRALLHILLNMTEDLPALADNNTYASILGFKKSSSALIKNIKNNSSIPVITKPADAKNILTSDALKVYENTVFASHVYESVLSRKYHTPALNMYKTGPVIL